MYYFTLCQRIISPAGDIHPKAESWGWRNAILFVYKGISALMPLEGQSPTTSRSEGPVFSFSRSEALSRSVRQVGRSGRSVGRSNSRSEDLWYPLYDVGGDLIASASCLWTHRWSTLNSGIPNNFDSSFCILIFYCCIFCIRQPLQTLFLSRDRKFTSHSTTRTFLGVWSCRVNRLFLRWWRRANRILQKRGSSVILPNRSVVFSWIPACIPPCRNTPHTQAPMGA